MLLRPVIGHAAPSLTSFFIEHTRRGGQKKMAFAERFVEMPDDVLAEVLRASVNDC